MYWSSDKDSEKSEQWPLVFAPEEIIGCAHRLVLGVGIWMRSTGQWGATKVGL
jgi:hypothetical protein